MNNAQRLWDKDLNKSTIMNKPRAIIVDIDGTLSNSDHREHLIHNGKRDQYFDLVGYDDLNDWCADLINQYKQNHKIILLTGRPERVRGDTVSWLEFFDVPFDLLIMRGDQDREQGFVYKKKIFMTRLEPVFDIRLVVDNDPLICEMFRKIGIPALEYDQEGEQESDEILTICDDLKKLVEYHHAGDTQSVIKYHEDIDRRLHNLVGEEGLRPEEKK
jgi:hypothetical protein